MTNPQSEKTEQLLHIFDTAFIGGEAGGRIEQKYITPMTTAGQLDMIALYPENESHCRILNSIKKAFCFPEDEFGYEIKLRESLTEIWLEILKLSDSVIKNKNINEKTNERLKLMMIYVHENFAEKILISDLAGAGYMSERDCFRTFRECLHMTPVEYITNYRLQRACQMLIQSKKTISVISHECGLGSSSYFGKLFREHIGITPVEYRRNGRIIPHRRKEMKEIKIAFFDIDGTLLKMGEAEMTENTKKALHLLRQKGIKICLATGRPLINIPPFEEIEFDGVLAFNGSFSTVKSEVITRCPIPEGDLRKIIENAEAMGRPVAIATADKIVANGSDKNLEDYFAIAHKKVVVSEAFDRLIKEDVYQVMIGCDLEERKRILDGTKDAKQVAWWDRAIDIIPRKGGKGTAIEELLAYYHFSKDEAIAFGDGVNDIDMLQAVGTGVAMGNASEEVKEMADEVCEEVEKDGVFHYLKMKKII